MLRDILTPMNEQKMFQPDQGFGPAKWLPWLFAGAAVYAILTLVPGAQNFVARITVIAVAVIGTAFRKRIIKWFSSNE
jgi:hypothetical protein